MIVVPDQHVATEEHWFGVPGVTYESRGYFPDGGGFALINTTGSAFSAHEHEGHRINLLLCGREREWLKGAQREFGPGEVSLVPAGESHYSPNDYGPMRYLTIAVPNDLMFCHWWKDIHRSVFAPMIWHLFGCVRDAAALPVQIESAYLELVESLTSIVFPHCDDAKWLVNVVQKMMDDPTGIKSLVQLAEEAGVHRCHFAKTIKARFRCTAGDLIMKRRVQLAAKQLVHSDDTMAAIAADFEFFDQSHMGRWFRRCFGLTPLQYRQLFRCHIKTDTGRVTYWLYPKRHLETVTFIYLSNLQSAVLPVGDTFHRPLRAHRRNC